MKTRLSTQFLLAIPRMLAHFYANRMDDALDLAQRSGLDPTESTIQLDPQIEAATLISAAQLGKLSSCSIEPAQLRRLIATCRSPTLPRLLLESVRERGTAELPSPFSEGVATSTESYELLAGINCLLFRDKHKCFVLVQEISSADGVFFPDENVLIGLTSAVSSQVSRRLAERIITNFPEVIEYARSTKEFGGLICSHHRPAHFYYELYPALFDLHEAGLLRLMKPTLITRVHQDFISTGALFGCAERSLPSSQIFSEAITTRQFFMTAGVDRSARENYHHLFRADRYLVRRICRQTAFRERVRQISTLGCHPLVWVGLEGQGRCWAEQVEGLAQALNALYEKHPGLGVVIDGWTSPLTQSSACVKEIARDFALASELMSKLQPGIQTLVLVGCTSEEKIAAASKIDFFITNYTTGSIHVSRFAGKPGICHSSSRLMETSLRICAQYHPNRSILLMAGTEIPPETAPRTPRLQDLIRPRKLLRRVFRSLENPSNLPLGAVNYSIEPAHMSEALLAALPGSLNRSAAELASFFIEFPSCLDVSLRLLLKILSRGHLISLKGNMSASLGQLGEIPPPRLRKSLVVGAMNFGIHRRVPIHARYMTWLVEPRRRLTADFATLSRGRGPEDATALALDRSRVLDNPYVRRLSGLGERVERCDEAAFQLALRNLERFHFIGVDASRDSSVAKLAEIFRFDKTILTTAVPQSLAATAHTLSGTGTPFPEEWVRFDSRLYAAAVSMA